jgi:hypothetical protein
MPRSGPILPARAGVTQSLSSAPGAIQRLLFIDNLRWLMIILVISMHAANSLLSRF